MKKNLAPKYVNRVQQGCFYYFVMKDGDKGWGYVLPPPLTIPVMVLADGTIRCVFREQLSYFRRVPKKGFESFV